MDEKITAIRNETATLQEMTGNLSALAYRLDDATGSATIRSMYTIVEAFRAELLNLQKLLDEFAE